MEMEDCQLNRRVLHVKKCPVSLVRVVLVSEMQTKGLGSRLIADGQEQEITSHSLAQSLPC